MGVLGIVAAAASGNASGGYGRFEVKRPWNFKVSFQAAGTLATDVLTDIAKNSLAVAVKSVGKPTITSQIIEIKNGNEMYNLAGKTKWTADTIEVVFNDIISPVAVGVTDTTGDNQASIVSAASVMYKWQNKVTNIYTGDGGLSVNYKANMYVTQLDPAGNAIETYIYFGGFPSEVRYGENLDFTQETEGGVITVTFKFDKIFRAGFGTSNETADPGLTVPTYAEAP